MKKLMVMTTALALMAANPAYAGKHHEGDVILGAAVGLGLGMLAFSQPATVYHSQPLVYQPAPVVYAPQPVTYYYVPTQAAYYPQTYYYQPAPVAYYPRPYHAPRYGYRVSYDDWNRHEHYERHEHHGWD